MAAAPDSFLSKLSRFLNGDPLAFSAHRLPEVALQRLHRAELETGNKNPRLLLIASVVYTCALLGCAFGYPAERPLEVWGLFNVGYWLLRYRAFERVIEGAPKSLQQTEEYTRVSARISAVNGLVMGLGAAIGFAGLPLTAIAPFALLINVNLIVPVLLTGASLLSCLAYVIPIVLGVWIGLESHASVGALELGLLYLVIGFLIISSSFQLTRRLALGIVGQIEEEHRGRKDALTQLGNRKAFEERLQAAADALGGAGKPFALVLFDLNGLKRVNDTYGHAAGDALIRHLADVLSEKVRGDGDFAGRLGGDEFVVILSEAEGFWAAALVQHIVETFKAPLDLGWGDFAPSVSVGVALAPRDGTDPHKLLRAADAAMYFNKQRGVVGLNGFGAPLNGPEALGLRAAG